MGIGICNRPSQGRSSISILTVHHNHKFIAVHPGKTFPAFSCISLSFDASSSQALLYKWLEPRKNPSVLLRRMITAFEAWTCTVKRSSVFRDVSRIVLWGGKPMDCHVVVSDSLYPCRLLIFFSRLSQVCDDRWNNCSNRQKNRDHWNASLWRQRAVSRLCAFSF